ncbi:c-type cytochrome [Burkholderia stagnalis]|uniref:Cytochrome C n=1 Tax=Burkholderia stagnalis TaxID=1503054 RepID=A0ABX9YIZ7_9BURK|nr:c-type cytochrome [Burkholderia stagnalis]RQQ56799.1 cytochrome C [Burkholderia stagnalis]RQQ65249.1 cytochrome C [Burkholderia stagnalis]RQQ66827.1 cytochrome C [Burkholderia stagnalis]RQQ77987.1 cytochrome C [Burkholderia stagnalis]RQQ86530.1 cytochrome C [Burkholderia stagnalis]
MSSSIRRLSQSLVKAVISIAALLPAFTAIAAQPPQANEAELVKQGAYVARLGDCIACHTSPNGAPLAGGLALDTPFGAIYSTNITPDDATGIGRYTFEQFDRAMRKGVAADGHHLYPAMPYPSFAKLGDDDMRALFAYLKQGVAPVKQENKPLGVKWPFNMRWGLALWNALFLDDTRYRTNPAKDATWNRGAYLTQGAGHCGACHTPRGVGFQEKTMSEAGSGGPLYLSGSTVESWRAVNLRSLWPVEDLVTLLKTGRNRFTTASGGMSDVVHHSTQYFSDADLTAIAVYLNSLPNAAADRPAAVSPTYGKPADGAPATLYTSKGGLGYLQFCSSCHQVDGHGFSPVFPPLSRNPAVLSQQTDSLIHVALTGWQTPQTDAHPRVYTMPAFSHLSDQELAEILTFVRSTWGGRSDPVFALDVRKMRRTLAVKDGGAPSFDTPRFANLLDQPNAPQLVRGMRLHLDTKALLPNHVGDALNCASCHLNAGTVAHASPFVGLAAQFPGYAPRAGKVISLAERINGCFRRSMNGKPLPVDSNDMKAMVAYFDWMRGGARPKNKIAGRGVGKIDTTLVPDLAHGKAVYAAQCASCHGADGAGMRRADGTAIYPPLWGDQSFNIGAGMARLYTAAAFVKQNMPIGAHDRFPLGQGGLSDQDAIDVAAWFTTQPRPDFPDKIHDWPKGGKPKDARY